MEYDEFWKFHNKANMDKHAISLIENQNKRIKELEKVLNIIAYEIAGSSNAKKIAEQALKGKRYERFYRNVEG